MDPKNVAESSVQSTNVGAIFADLGHQVALLDQVRGQLLSSDVRDGILLSLTAMQNDLNSKISSVSDQKVDAAFNCRRNLEILFHLIDCRDLLVSYCSSQLIRKIAVQPSCQEVVEVVLVNQWTEMLSLRCSSVAGILHRIEILHDILSKRFFGSLSVDSKLQGLQVVIGSILVEQWEAFLRFIFQSDTNDEVHQSHLYPNIILSASSLWIKLIQTENQKSLGGGDSTHNNIFCLTDLLLKRLQTGSLSQICHRKSLRVLLECLPYSCFLSPMRVIPSLYHEVARRNLSAFANSSIGDLRADDPDDLSGDFRPGTSWIQRCVMRSSLSQGFGGFCKTGESFSDSSVDDVSTVCGEVTAVDQTVLRKLVLLWLRSLAVEAHGSADEGIDICRHLNSLESFVCFLLSSNPNTWLLRLFGEQDDDLFEALLCLLDIYVLTKKRSSDDVNWLRFEPCRLFLRFLESGCWDHTLLVDLLMSPETCFLIYLTRLLKHIISDWGYWVSVCQNKEESVFSADVNLSRNVVSSCDNNASVDEFKNVFESVEMKESSSVERFRSVPLSSLKQLEENYRSLLSEENAGSVAENEHSLLGNSLAGRSNRSSIKKIIDYSDSESDRSEELTADEDRSFGDDVVDDEKPGSSKRDISSDDRSMVTDAYLGCSGEVIKTFVNCLISSRTVNGVEAETDLRHSSVFSYKCHAVDDSNNSSFRLSELSDDSDSRMDVETDGSSSDATYDDIAEKKREELKTSSVGMMPVMDRVNEGEEQCVVNAMTTLIRLRLCLTRLVSKDIFPYSIRPLERLLESCEEIYEKVW